MSHEKAEVVEGAFRAINANGLLQEDLLSLIPEEGAGLDALLAAAWKIGFYHCLSAYESGAIKILTQKL